LVHAAYVSSILYSRLGHPFEMLGNFFTKIAKNKFEQKFWMYLLYPYLLIYSFYFSILEGVGFHKEEDFDFNPKTNKSHNNDSNNSSSVDISSSSSSSLSPFKGSTWIIHNLAMTYLMPSLKNLINSRIERAVLEAVKQNVRVVVLGNFNKAEWMNHGGDDIVKNLGSKLEGTLISHGDTLTASVIYHYALNMKNQGHWNKAVFVTGATSKIGRAVCLSLAKLGIPVKLFSQCKPRFDEIAAELTDPIARACLTYASTLKEGNECDLWLTGKMIPSGKELLVAIPDNATVINFSVPDPLTPELLSLRPDLLHLDTGLLEYDDKSLGDKLKLSQQQQNQHSDLDKEMMNPAFTWLLPAGRIYSCLAGGIVHSALGINSHEIGPVDINNMDLYWEKASEMGFKIPTQHSSFYDHVQLPQPRYNPSSVQVVVK